MIAIKRKLLFRFISCAALLTISVTLAALVCSPAQASPNMGNNVVPIIVSMLLDEETPQPPSTNAISYAQKGPFRAGATVTIQPLDNTNISAGGSVITRTGDRGLIQLAQRLPNAALWAWVSIDGMAFNENTALDEIMHLEGLVPVKNGVLEGNLNVFSWLVGQRARVISTSNNQELSLAIIDAQRQAYRAFGLYTEPHKIDILVDRAFNAHALLFSAALLKLANPQQSLTELVNDFADDGRINTEQGGAILESLALRSTQETLDTAIANINAEYGINLSARVATGLLPLENVPCGDQVCLGKEQIIALEPGDTGYVPVKIFESGTYALQVIHSTFNLFHTGILRNSMAAAIASLGQGGTPVLALEAGDGTIEGGARNNSSQDDITATLRLFRVGDGTLETPKYIPVNQPNFGIVSQLGGQANAYYAIEAGNGSVFRVNLSDVRSNDSFRITITDRSGTIYQKEDDGGVILDFDSPSGSAVIHIQYTDASQVNMAGSLDFRLAVTAISSAMANIDPDTIIRN